MNVIHKVICKVMTYLILFLFNAIYLVACILPKRKSLWLISAWFGKKFIDNPKYIYKELAEGNYPVDVYWLVKDKKLIKAHEKYPFVYTYSLKGLWLQLRAEVVIFTHSIRSEYIPCLIGGSTKKIQTWHGIPMKKIGYDDRYANLDSLKNKIIEFCIPFLKENYDLVLAASDCDKEIYHTAFRAPLEQIVVTGYPRNDEIYSCTKRKSRYQKQELKIIYMPTLRGGLNSEFPLLSGANFNFEKVDQRLGIIGGTLYIKLHPVQKFNSKDIDSISNSKNMIAVFNTDDIYESIGEYDILITDYSGIFFDFLITGKPIIMAPLDYEDYIKNDREIYYEYLEVCPTLPLYNWENIMDQISVYANSYDGDMRYSEIQRRFHKYIDGNSSKRAIDEINKCLDIEFFSKKDVKID